jgi:hypothetical protein
MQNVLLERDAALALQAFNQLVHCAHNTGWAFNKFLCSEALTITAENPVYSLVGCAPQLYEANRRLAEDSDQLAELFCAERQPVSVPSGEPNYEVTEPERDGERSDCMEERRHVYAPAIWRRIRGIRLRSRGMDGSSTRGWAFPLCPHRPQCVLNGQSGWSVWTGAEGDCMQRMGTFQLLLNLTGTSVLSRHIVPVPELQRWEEPAALPEIVLNWPDMGIVSLPRRFWEELAEYLTNTQQKMLVFCVGGHGRTGTALACLMVVCGWTSEDAIAWIRTNYCQRAIETREQERYVMQIERDSPIQ